MDGEEVDNAKFVFQVYENPNSDKVEQEVIEEFIYKTIARYVAEF